MSERDKNGRLIISDVGGVVVTDNRDKDGRPASMSLTERVGDITTDDGRVVEFLRAWGGAPVFMLRWAKDDPVNPGGDLEINVTQAIYDALNAAEKGS